MFSILQLLPPEERLAGGSVNIKQLCIRRCESDAKMVEQYLKVLPPDPLIARGLFVSLLILVTFLDDMGVHRLFTQSCHLLRSCIGLSPMVRLLIKAIQASAWSLKKEIPASARVYFEGLDEHETDRDPPMSFVLPHRSEVRELLSAEGQREPHHLGVQLRTLISRWSDLSLG